MQKNWHTIGTANRKIVRASSALNSFKFAGGMVLATAPFALIIVFSLMTQGPWITLGIVATVALACGSIWAGVVLVDQAMHGGRNAP